MYMIELGVFLRYTNYMMMTLKVKYLFLCQSNSRDQLTQCVVFTIDRPDSKLESNRGPRTRE